MRIGRTFFAIVSLSVFTAIGATAKRAEWVSTEASGENFPLVAEQPATIVVEGGEPRVVAIAAEDLASDIFAVSGQRPLVSDDPAAARGPVVLLGTLGHGAWIERLVTAGKLDLSRIEGQWESFLMQSIEAPWPGLERAFVVIGSDRRGTAYGAYELSRAIGVSPWAWWADVPPVRSEALYLQPGATVVGPPSVKYRGIFLNDEDWGLHRWAALTYDPELGDIGPKTYRRVFELLLRLRANTLWPAMHEVTKAFNLYPENKHVADEYAIVMGSSHAEPMLRNNVTEWTAPHRDYNYRANREGVLEYWRQRVEENAAFENHYTLGMRGIHDSGMVGTSDRTEQIGLMERIFADQRALLERYVEMPLENVPQMFVPYKEVLGIYRDGLTVPDDVTIVWPNDNHGYIRHLPDARERTRSGGSGVYYHISYLGSPLAYLWLHTTPHALIWYELSKAHEHGAREFWMLNVGDLKPAEIGVEFFFDLAWAVDRWSPDNLDDFLPAWAERTFGEEHAAETGAILTEYFRLNHQRRPEHLQWYLPHTRFRMSPLDYEATRDRLLAFEDISERARSIGERLPGRLQDAWFQLVFYPVRASALANQRYFGIEQYHRHFNRNPPLAAKFGAVARRAEAELAQWTRYYNEELAGGKWRHYMAVEPADTLWRSYRQNPQILPAENMVSADPALTLRSLFVEHPGKESGLDRAVLSASNRRLVLPAEAFVRSVDKPDAAWRIIPGLGHTGASVAVFPTTAETRAPETLTETSPWLEYRFGAESLDTSELEFEVWLLPTYPIPRGVGLRIALALDGQAPVVLAVERETGDARWAESVLEAGIAARVTLTLPADLPHHSLRLYMLDPGVVVDRLVLSLPPRTD
jgi:hypothetical protein